MKRIILPVGQGNFAIEKFINSNVVFDCGCMYDKSIVNKLIDEQFGSNETIDAVFISHLDDDHINGIDHLIKRCFVKKIIIPYIECNQKLLYQLHNLIKYGNKLSYSAKKILDILDEDTPEYRNDFPEVIYIPIINLENGITYDYNSAISNIMSNVFPNWSSDWKFIPFNYDFKNRKAMFYTELNKHSKLKHLNCFNLIKYWKLYKKDIKEIYKKHVKGSINSNSMVVYSGPRSNYHLTKSIYPRIMDTIKAGALYTGDFNASIRKARNELINYYSIYKNMLGLFMVPHHGANKNHDISLIAQYDSVCIISSRSTSKYHPSRNVILDILSLKRTVVIVTEKTTSFTQLIVGV